METVRSSCACHVLIVIVLCSTAKCLYAEEIWSHVPAAELLSLAASSPAGDALLNEAKRRMATAMTTAKGKGGEDRSKSDS